MAIPAQNLVFSWGGVALQEIREMDLRLSYETDTATAGREQGPSFYTSGELTLTGFSRASLPLSNLLFWQTMLITAPVGVSGTVTLYNGYAQYVASNVSVSANGVVLFAFQFRLYGAF